MFNPDWKNVRDSLMERVEDFAKANPQAIAGYARLEEGAAKAKELGCTKEEIADALGVALAMNAGAALVYSSRILEAFDQAPGK